MVRNKVTDEEIAEVVSKWTHIPVSKLMESEKEKLLHLGDILHERVIGQNEAVDRVSDAVLRARSGLKDPAKPIGSFIFLGPTGVGKTEMAKVLSSFLFDKDDSLIRIDMSEYMEKHSVASLHSGGWCPIGGIRISAKRSSPPSTRNPKRSHQRPPIRTR